MTNLKSQQNSVNQIFDHVHFSLLLTGAKRYYHAICIVFTHFASFTGYEDDIFEVILICMFTDPNLAEDLKNLPENLFKKFTPRRLCSWFFPSLSYYQFL